MLSHTCNFLTGVGEAGDDPVIEQNNPLAPNIHTCTSHTHTHTLTKQASPTVLKFCLFRKKVRAGLRTALKA